MNSKASDVSEGVDPHAFGMARAGERVVFTGEGGYDHDREDALALWTVGTELLVESCYVGGWESNYRFVGWPGAHNTVMFEPRATLSPPLPSPDKDLIRLVEILRRALVWHGDRARMATTREDWQQEIDEAINWVRDNPEEGRPSTPTIADALPSLEVERLRGLLAKIQENGRRLPWQLWTSCSFRRIKTGHLIDDRGDGLDVLSGYRCSDGVVDLSMPEEQLQALVELLNALPAALSALPLDGGL